MHTELEYKCNYPGAPPLPPPPHFDLDSIAAAKRVQPLRRPRVSRYSGGVLRLGTAFLAGVMVMSLGIATMARLNKQIDVAPAKEETSEPADAPVDASAAVETESTLAASSDDLPPLVITDRRRHRARRHIRIPREMFEQPMFVW